MFLLSFSTLFLRLVRPVFAADITKHFIGLDGFGLYVFDRHVQKPPCLAPGTRQHVQDGLLVQSDGAWRKTD